MGHRRAVYFDENVAGQVGRKVEVERPVQSFHIDRRLVERTRPERCGRTVPACPKRLSLYSTEVGLSHYATRPCIGPARSESKSSGVASKPADAVPQHLAR